MIIKCEACKVNFDDKYRTTLCPHNTFLANNGRNEFQHHPKSYLSTDGTTDINYQSELYNNE